MNWFRLIIFCICSSLIACTTTPNSTEGGMPQERFFDLSQYFTEQVKNLQGQARIQKTATINGKEESLTLNDPDFRQELQLFIDSDINRTSWLDKYAVDSTFDAAGNLSQLAYIALEDRLRTRQVAIDFMNNNVERVQILNATDNVIAQTKQELDYSPQRGYAIKSFQDILLTDPRTIEVKVTF